MNTTAILKLKALGIPIKPGAFCKRQLANITVQLQSLAVYDEALDNKLVVPYDGDAGRQQSRILNCARTANVRVKTAKKPEQDDAGEDLTYGVIYVYRYA